MAAVKKRILIVDEQDLLRAGIAAVLADRAGYVVHDALVRPPQALRQIDALAPDLVIVDPFDDETRELSGLTEIRERHPALPLLVLTGKFGRGRVQRALNLRVNGYMLKSSPASDIAFAVDTIFAGRTFLHPDVSHVLINDQNAWGAGGSDAPLTARQEQVLRMIADGKSTRQIASILGLSAKTVEFHRVMLMNRLGIHHVPGLVRYALRYGYASGDAATA